MTSARVFLHPRLIAVPVAHSAFEACLQERGFDLKTIRVVRRVKYFELCRVISDCPTSAVYEGLDGERFTKGVMDVPAPEPTRAA